MAWRAALTSLPCFPRAALLLVSRDHKDWMALSPQEQLNAKTTKADFVSEWFILYSADQNTKLQRSLSIVGSRTVVKIKKQVKKYDLESFCSSFFFHGSVQLLMSAALLIKAAMLHDQLFLLSSFHFQISHFCEGDMMVKMLYWS